MRWPGLPAESTPPPIRIVVAGTPARFDSLTGGVLPSWTAAVAIPDAATIIVPLHGDPGRLLRHELAHLALHRAVRGIPRWFDEGYAAVAAGEWDRLDALRVDWQLVRGLSPTLDQVERELLARGPVEAEAAYALATTAVQFLDRLGGDRGLAPLLSAWQRTGSLDAAVREVHAVTLDRFEELWQRDLRSRYGWLSFLASTAVLWGGIVFVLLASWWWRRRRDRERRLHLDEGWEIPPPEDGPSA